VELAIRKVADWQLAQAASTFNQQWKYAALYDGMQAVSRETGDQRYSYAVQTEGTNLRGCGVDTKNDRPKLAEIMA
jgi:hypothetical protein